MQVKPRDTKCLSGFDGQLRRPHHFVGGVTVNQVAVQVAGHRRESGSGGGQRFQVLVVPAPYLDREAKLVDAPHPVDDRQVGEDHLGADRQLEAAHCSTAFRTTGARGLHRLAGGQGDLECDARVGAGHRWLGPGVTQSTKWANCAT